MPRLFMALRQEDRLPIVEIWNRTPAIPERAQWGMFLRNHDELTLEMVTHEERDYLTPNMRTTGECGSIWVSVGGWRR
jgi:maltose alpha-D-glucosyltransferase/alpha-amylase